MKRSGFLRINSEMNLRKEGGMFTKQMNPSDGSDYLNDFVR